MPKHRTSLRREFFLLGTLLVAGGWAQELEAQRTVHILEEPRHRKVLSREEFHVLDIQINAGDTTLLHTHDSPILYTFISSGAGSSNGRVSSNTEYLTENFTHQVSNAGPGLFRIIAVAHYGAGVGDGALAASRPAGLEGEPQLENPWFRSYRIELAPGAESPLHRHRTPVLVVQVGDGISHVTREDGVTTELIQQGDWAWREAESSYRIRNVGTAPLALVVNEVR